MGGVRIPRRGFAGSRATGTLVALALVVAGCEVAKVITASPSPTFDPAPLAGWAWHDNVVAHRGEDGQTFDYACPADGGLGDVWGTDTYTDDSSVCTAAVHMGFLVREEGGIVRIAVRPGQERYEGSLRNGILSETYGAWDGSFTVVASCRGDACATEPSSPP